jgi:hypothetical protein
MLLMVKTATIASALTAAAFSFPAEDSYTIHKGLAQMVAVAPAMEGSTSNSLDHLALTTDPDLGAFRFDLAAGQSASPLENIETSTPCPERDGYVCVWAPEGSRWDVIYAPIPQSAVPEPSSWVMMLLGFGAVGSAIRRRRVSFSSRLQPGVRQS